MRNHQPPRRRAHGFTLIELILASTLSLIVVTAATSLAVGIMNARNAAAAAGLVSARLAIAHSFIERELSSTGFQWFVSQKTVGGLGTFTWGQAFCAESTNLCPGGSAAGNQILPVEICSAATASTCTAPVAGSADVLKVIVPRDPVIDMVQIVRHSDGTTNFGDGGFDTCADLSTTQAFDVSGPTTLDWKAGDLLLIAKKDRVSVVKLAADFNADTSPASERDLSIDFGGNTNNLVYNDGGDTSNAGGDTAAGCLAGDRLKSASVFRIKQIIMRTSGLNGELQMAVNDTSVKAGVAPVWLPLVKGVDDLQFKLDIATFPQNNAAGASTCGCNSTDVLTGTTFGAQCPLCTTGKTLWGDNTTDECNRLIGLHIGLLVRGGVAKPNSPPVAWTGLFDRSSTTVVTDRRLRRKGAYYVGFPNAQTF